MRVKLLTSLAGPDWSGQHGQTVDLPEATAVWLCDRGQAEPVREARRETATKSRREKAVKA